MNPKENCTGEHFFVTSAILDSSYAVAIK